jgi:hypothetical protein
MDKNKIKIVNKIEKFEFIIRVWTSIKGRVGFLLNTGNEKSTYKQFDALIRIKNKDEDITIGLYGDFPENYYTNISWRSLEEQIVEQIIDTFQLSKEYSIKGNPFAIILIDDKVFSPNMVIKKSHVTNNYFIIVYHFDDGESRKSPELYVHGIWEVELSEEFKKSLNMEK